MTVTRFRLTLAFGALLAVAVLTGCGRAGDLRKPYHEPVASDAAKAAPSGGAAAADAKP